MIYLCGGRICVLLILFLLSLLCLLFLLLLFLVLLDMHEDRLALGDIIVFLAWQNRFLLISVTRIIAMKSLSYPILWILRIFPAFFELFLLLFFFLIYTVGELIEERPTCLLLADKKVNVVIHISVLLAMHLVSIFLHAV